MTPKTKRLMTRFTVLSWILLLSWCADAVYGETVKGVQVTEQSLYEDHGTTSRGYGEIRLLLRNTSSEAQQVYLQWPGDVYRSGDGMLGSCSRRLELNAGQSAEISLFWPGIELAGDRLLIQVGDKSRLMAIQNNLGHSSLTGDPWSYPMNESVPVILCDRDFDTDFRNQLRNAFDPYNSSSSMHSSSSPYGGEEYVSVIRPTASASDWSTNWISYWRFDAVVLKPESYDDLSTEARTALADYVSVGGQVWIVWDGNLTNDMFSEVREAEGLGKVWISPLAMGDEFANEVTLRNTQHTVLTWDAADKNLPLVERAHVPTRLMSLLLITYAIAIGPILLFVLSKKRRRIWILWIIPTVSLLICFTVGTWAYYREGIHGHARMRLLTVLDQRNDRATTHGLVGFYTPVTDGRGLRFSSSCILEPQWEPNYNSYDYYGDYSGSPIRGLQHMDWNSGQHLGRGWLQAKTPVHFQIWKVERRREELTFSNVTSRSIDVTNALGADIRELRIHLPDGTYAEAEQIAAGEKATLSRRSGSSNPRSSISIDALGRSLIHSNESYLDSNFQTDQVSLDPGSYIAIAEGHPMVDTAITKPKTDRGETILIGRFELEE
jgi:hypothetical protein